MIDEEYLKQNLIPRLGLKTELFETISYSTNDRVKELISAGYKDALVAAESQAGGRGRVGRTWLSTDNSVAMSFSASPNIDITSYPLVALIAALSIAKALGEDIRIKWPNDILIGDKKVCGVLCELHSCESINYAIIGIGVNIGQSSGARLDLPHATTLMDEGISISKEEIITRIYNNFLESLEVFEEAGFKPFAKEYNERLAHLDEEVILLDSASHGGNIEEAEVVLQGVCKGVDEGGKLMIEDKSGLHLISTGELSLRRR